MRYRQNAVIYAQSHADRFAGVKGVVGAEDVANGKVRIIAPEGFLEHSISDSIIAGPAMGRRASFQFGARLSPGETGSPGSGIGVAVSDRTRSLIAPTATVTMPRAAVLGVMLAGMAIERQLDGMRMHGRPSARFSKRRRQISLLSRRKGATTRRYFSVFK